MSDQNRPPQPPIFHEPPQQNPKLNPNMLDVRSLKSGQTLMMIASIAGPVSLFLGGVFLSTLGLVCAVIAFKKIDRLAAKQNDIGAAARQMRISCIIALVVCGIALVLNAIAFYLMYPVVLEAIESGDYGSIIPGADQAPSKSNSAWG